MATTLKEFAQELKRLAPLDRVVAEYVPSLRRAGRSFKGLCPFHEEKTPSFIVNPEWERYKCFGCGAGGDALNFIQEMEKVDFPLAIELLAKRVGVIVPEFEKGMGREEREDAERRKKDLREVCKLAERLFIDRLASHPRGAVARQYLEKRGLTPDQIRRYRIGYAPPEFDASLAPLRQRGYRDTTLAEAGLAIQSEKGGYYGRFRDRIIFPIDDRQGEVVAFGGRLLEGDGPKYLNSPETPIFKKGELLFGLAEAREAIRDAGRAILLEGYMDWIALHSHGIENVVAGLGTALTNEQARLIRRMSDEVVMLYDGDDAGRAAMFRASEALLGQGLRARAAVLEAGEDPDSYVRGRGTGALGELIDRASGALDFFSDEAFSNWDAGRPEGKSAIAERLAPLLRSLREPVLQEASVNQLASRLALQPATVWKALKKGARRELTAKGEGAEPGEEAPRELNRLECCLLNRLMRRDAPLAFVETLEEDLFSEAILKSLFLRIREAARRKAAEKAGSPDWIELFQDENEIQAMNHVLFIEERHLGGALAAQPLSAVICGDLEIECREMAARLRRKRSMRLRGQAVRELRFQFSELDRAREGLGRVHRHAWSVSQQTRMLVEESGQTSAGGNQV